MALGLIREAAWRPLRKLGVSLTTVSRVKHGEDVMLRRRTVERVLAELGE
jgi:DNA-binding LacI/PurR family transcriptional regulator